MPSTITTVMSTILMTHTAVAVWAVSSSSSVMSAELGVDVGSSVDIRVGRGVGVVVGVRVGRSVGLGDGRGVGDGVGRVVGSGVGGIEGAGLGGVVGVSVGAGVGENVLTETESTDAADIVRRRRPPLSRPVELERRRWPSRVANVTIALVNSPFDTDLLSTSTT